MFGIQLTDYDKKIYEEKLADFLPDKMIDAHAHVWTDGMKRKSPAERKGCVSWTELVAPNMTYEDINETNRILFPGKSVTPVLMGSPTCYLDPVNAYVSDIIKKHGGKKASSDETLRADLVEEMADVLMYYNEVLLCYGITAEELKQAYTAKFEKNMHRW